MCQSNPIWIICDARRRSDLDFFRTHFDERLLLIRIEATDATRMKRGWTFTSGIDDAQSECQLDTDVQWSFVFHNDHDEEFAEQLDRLVTFCRAD
jgi:phosphomevalonate kinase